MKRILAVLMVMMFILVLGCQTAVQAPVKEAAAPAVVQEESPAVSTGNVNTVVIAKMQFQPADLTIKVGDTVEWVNNAGMTHTVTFENGDFDQRLSDGATATHTFLQKGEFRYFCQIHPGMQGTIVVN